MAASRRPSTSNPVRKRSSLNSSKVNVKFVLNELYGNQGENGDQEGDCRKSFSIPSQQRSQRMDSLAYEQLAEQLFGRTASPWQPQVPRNTVTSEERRLLDQLEVVHAHSAMPPGILPNPSKRKVRPSSAAAKLQSHPCFATGLYDDGNVRPSTAVGAAGPPGPLGLPGRPKTQATGRRFQMGSSLGTSQSVPENELHDKQGRRLTVGTVEGIAEVETSLTKKFSPTPPATVLLKGKDSSSGTDDSSTDSESEIESDSELTESERWQKWLGSQPWSRRQWTYFLTGDSYVSESPEPERQPTEFFYDRTKRFIRTKGWIEEKLSIDTLEELKKAFESSDNENEGKLDLVEFKTLLKNRLNLSGTKEGQIDALFQKIDWSSEGEITWDEFCTYMQLEYAEKEDSYLRAKDVTFHLPAKIESMPHREPVLRITGTSDGMFIACSQDGMVTFWSGSIDHKRTRNVITAEQSARQKPKWITDFVLMPQYNKLIIGTGDREIQFFELSSFEPYCQINGLETVPHKLDYCATGEGECIVLYGDSMGCVNIVVITNAGECLRTWKKAPKAEGIASVSIDTVAQGPHTRYIRWQVHGDWVQQLKYYHGIRMVISCSNHASTALVIGCTLGSTDVGQQLKDIKDTPAAQAAARSRAAQACMAPKTRLPADQSVFKIYKGVKCFDFSKQKNIIITGGMDRIIRMWNPYVPGKPTGMLRGHNSPIFFLFVAEEEERIFSISTDKCIKVWDIHDQNCLLTIRPKGHKIRGDLQACHYSNTSKALAVATDQMNGLQLKLKPGLSADIVITHKEPIHACIYNPSFKQVITCSDGSVVKLWDFETGNPIFEYGEAHGDSAITCMTFDKTGRRLITGGRDGCIRLWNFNNGHCLKTMMKEKENEEICALNYIEMNKNKYVIAVGWDKRINIYSDAPDENIHHIQHPLPKWPDDEVNGHREDILSVTQCPPNLLATSSYDGEIIVWNMVSGHIFCHLHAPAPEGYRDTALDGDLSINKLIFLRTRAYSKDAASLIASGPRGHIHFWRVFHGGSLLAQFPGSRHTGSMVTAMEANTANTVLVSADSLGFLYVWNIRGYCQQHAETESPELLQTWRGHVESVTALVLVEEQRMILSSSLDCTVRLWTWDGEYVGTFGQPEPWDIYNKETYQHPMVPYDVLIDPMSMPDHPVLSEKQNVHQVIHEDTPRGEEEQKEKEPRSPTPSKQYGRQQFYVDDETIAEQLKQKPFNKGTGKRLRHEKLKPVKIDRGGPSEFQMLQCYDLEPTPQPTPPAFKVNREDPFDFYAD